MNATRNSDPFADMDDDIIATQDAAVREFDAEQAAQQRFVTAKPAPTEHREQCAKCGGTGRVRWGRCFACNGVGFKMFKTSPEQRARARDQAHERKLREIRDNWDGFVLAHPEVAAWIKAHEDRFDFALSMHQAVCKYGHLTDGQMAAVARCMDRDAARAAAQAAKAAAAPAAVHLNKLHAVMQRHAKFYAGALTLSRRNADQLVWIKHEGSERVVGKIDNGVLTLWTRPGVDMDYVRDMLNEFEQDPLAAAKKFGKLSGRCCSCGRDLTNDESIAAGIGPICAERFD